MRMWKKGDSRYGQKKVVIGKGLGRSLSLRGAMLALESGSWRWQMYKRLDTRTKDGECR